MTLLALVHRHPRLTLAFLVTACWFATAATALAWHVVDTFASDVADEVKDAGARLPI